MENVRTILDIEILPNYFLIVMKSLETGNTIEIDIVGRDTRLSKEQKSKIHSILKKYTSVGFNSLKYDMPLINYALGGANCYKLFEASKEIVENRRGQWWTYKNFNINDRGYDHIDLIEPSPAVMVSLKGYGTRLGSKKLKEFYLNPYEDIAEKDIPEFRAYCHNDVDVTIDLYNAVKDRIKLRSDMMTQYKGIPDLRSKSDAQVAEEIFKYELKLDNPRPPKPPKYITYTVPDYIKFNSPKLNEILEAVTSTPIEVKQSNGQPILPKEWSKLLKPKIGDTVYKIGLGGIHSQEKKLVVESNDEYVLRNADIASMYPSILLTLGLYPEVCGKKFLDVYRNIYNTRLKAKHKVAELKAKLKELKKLL